MLKRKQTIWGKSPYKAHHIISIDGEARSLGSRTSYAKELKVTIHPNGYPQIEDGSIHRLIGLIFIPRKLGKPHVCHRDDVKTNNTIENLYWGDAFDNMQDASRNRRFKHPTNWIKAATKAKLRSCTIDNGVEVKQFSSMQDAAKYIGCSAPSMSQAVRTGGKTNGYKITKH